MQGKPDGWWVVLGLVAACSPVPSEVVAVHDSESTGATTGEHGSGGPAGTGSVTEGSGSATAAEGSTGAGSRGDGTTEPGTSTALPEASTGTASTGNDRDDSPTTGDESCTEIYGRAPGFELCSESDDACTFDVDLGSGDCDAICTTYGGTCVGAFGNASAGGCTQTGMDDCSYTANTEICVCTK
jgi:hypothetical protein